MGRRIVLAVAAVASLALIGLCSRAPVVTHGSFVARANEICADVRRALGALPSPSPEDPLPYYERVVAENRTAEGRFRGLEVPEEDEVAFLELLDAIGGANGALEDMVAASRAGDEDAVEAAQGRLEDARARFDVMADFLDLTDCRTAG